MNYNDQILENKPFNFTKQLIFNIALSICIMLAIWLVVGYTCGYGNYNVLSRSEQPYLMKGDLAIIQKTNKFEVGDLLHFKMIEKIPGIIGDTAVHRLIRIVEYNGETYYICHGDNDTYEVEGSYHKPNSGGYQDDIDYINTLSVQEIWNRSDLNNIQRVHHKDALGKVVMSVSGLGDYFSFVEDNTALFITMVIGVWCVSSVIQTTIDINKTRRLW